MSICGLQTLGSHNRFCPKTFPDAHHKLPDSVGSEVLHYYRGLSYHARNRYEYESEWWLTQLERCRRSPDNVIACLSYCMLSTAKVLFLCNMELLWGGG